MRQQISDGELACNVRVVEPKLRQDVDHAIVEMQLALVDEHAERCRSHCLGGRADGEARVLVGALRRPNLQYAVSFREDERVILDDRDGERRHVPVLRCLLHIAIERPQIGRGILCGGLSDCNDAERGAQNERAGKTSAHEWIRPRKGRRAAPLYTKTVDRANDRRLVRNGGQTFLPTPRTIPSTRRDGSKYFAATSCIDSTVTARTRSSNRARSSREPSRNASTMSPRTAPP